MAERIQQSLHLFSRGIDVLLPPDNGSTHDSLQSTRIHVLEHDGILKKRYPTPEVGRQFMTEVCPNRRYQLLSLADYYTPKFVAKWNQLYPDRPVAVLLFGSVAKGLVKGIHVKDPTNIDLTVLTTTVTHAERDAYLDSVRSIRQEIQHEILQDIPYTQSELESQGENPANAGVHVQDINRLSKNGYNGAITLLVGSSAFALHDPYNLWKPVETAALQDYKQRLTSPRSNYLTKKQQNGMYFSISH